MSNLIPILSGTGVALVTPFNSSKEIDDQALAKVIEHAIAGGVEYVVTLGTTGGNAHFIKGRKDSRRKIYD